VGVITCLRSLLLGAPEGRESSTNARSCKSNVEASLGNFNWPHGSRPDQADLRLLDHGIKTETREPDRNYWSGRIIKDVALLAIYSN
jgi:hypothetical protein